MTAPAAVALTLGTLLVLSQPSVIAGVRKGQSLNPSSEASSSSGDGHFTGVRDGGCGNATAALLALRGTTFGYSEVFQNATRTHWVHLPPTYNASAPLPLVLAFHGWWGSGREFERVSGFSDASDRHDFIVVYPDGNDDNPNPPPPWMARETKWRSWNAAGSARSPGPEGPICYAGGDPTFCYDSCRGRRGGEGCDPDGCDWTTCVDDVAWVGHLLARRLVRDLCVDEDRVYATVGEEMGNLGREGGPHPDTWCTKVERRNAILPRKK